MEFNSIEDLVERTTINITAASCLGKAGALSLLDDLNELEAGEYASSLVQYYRNKQNHKDKAREGKYEELYRKWEEEIEKRNKKNEEKKAVYQEKYRQYEEKLTRWIEKEKTGKNTTKQPEPPKLKILKLPVPPSKTFCPEPTKPPKPVTTLSGRERLRLQREMLKVFLSGHPLDEAKPNPETVSIKFIKEGGASGLVIFRGILLSEKIINTRKKQLMSRCWIEDQSAGIELILFPSVYDQYHSIIKTEHLYEIVGKPNFDSEDDQKITSIICVKIEEISIGSDKEWEIKYPLLRGTLRILQGGIEKSKGKVTSILIGKARNSIQQSLGS
jgi:DNA polymerase III alpha subunit